MIIPGAEGELEVPLTGEGATGTLTPSSSPLRFSPLPYARPEDEGEGNETEELNVLDSLAGSEITSVSIAGPDASSFSLNYGNCEHNTMASGNTCDEGVRFEPRTTGTKHAVLLIESDASSGALEIPLEGVALNGAQLSIDSSQALLGEVALGGSAQHVFTLSNTGDYPLFLERAFLVSGTPLMFPKLQDSCSGHVIQPGSSCSMTIAFQPSTVGEKDAGMILITNATPSIQVIGIDGVGVVPSPVSASSTLQPSTPATVPFAVLATVHPPRLESGATLHTGFLARCPSSTGGCQILSRATTATHTHAPGSLEASVTSIGSSRSQLAAGAAARAHIHLTPRATMLLNRRLKHQGRLTITITTEVRAGAETLATSSRRLVLLPQASGTALTNY